MSKIEFETKALPSIKTTGLKIKWQRPTLPHLCSTIGAIRLNFSVRNGKRWNPHAITTLVIYYFSKIFCMPIEGLIKLCQRLSCQELMLPYGYFNFSY